MRNSIFFTLLFSIVLICSVPVHGEERITSFESVVDILQSGQLVVAETITVVSEGRRIRHGIYRDFPTRYSDTNGKAHSVDFSVVSVELDGHTEPFHTKKLRNGVRIYMGTKERFVDRGVHTYILHYITNRQLGFFPDHDELFWNVTGNGWDFAIEQARVTIVIPESGEITDFEMYTGGYGSRDTDARLVNREPASITLETTTSLPPHSGFSVVVAWPKGVIEPPGSMRRFSWVFRDHLFDILSVAGLLLLVGYYYISWLKVGRDPQAGTIIPRFTPPENLSPAAARYLLKMSYDNKAFAALLVNMAVKRVIDIKQHDSKYTLKLLPHDQDNLLPGELALQKYLFQLSDSITLHKQNNSIVREAVNNLKTVLSRDVLDIYFRLNRVYLIFGLILSAGITVCVILASSDKGQASTITLWITMWSVGVGVLL
ncbi:MAG: hypothetical protein DSY70_05740, partial [Desulfobulbus sp.]